MGKQNKAVVTEFAKRNRLHRAEGVFGHGKRGGVQDPLEKLALVERTLTPQAARALYEASWFARNVVDVFAEDMVRRGFRVHTGDAELDKIVNVYLKRLEIESRLHDLVRHDLIFGNGFGLAVVADGRSLESPLNWDHIKSLSFLGILSQLSVSAEAELDEEITSPTYGDILFYKFTQRGRSWRVHHSRVLHLAMRALYGEKFGKSVFIPMLQIIKVLDSAEWSAGQILYSLVTKVIKGNWSGLSDAEERALQEELEQSLNMLTTVLLGKGEEFEFKSPAGVTQGVAALLDFVWECAAGAARIPRTHLIGQQAGAIAGAREDTKTYYARIAGLQKAYLEPLILRVVKMVLAARDGGGLKEADILALPLSVSFMPLESLDEREQAQALLDKARAIQTLVDTGLVDLKKAQEMLGI